MKDPYLSNKQQYKRLKADYDKHGKLIVAFDFDNTLYDFHNVGDTYPKLKSLLVDCQYVGFTIIIYTGNDDYSLIHRTMSELGINTYSINESKVPSNTIKPYANIVLDDRSGLKSAYKTLNKLITDIKD